MADTVRTRAELVTSFADNTSNLITAQNQRDFLISGYLKADVDGLLAGYLTTSSAMGTYLALAGGVLAGNITSSQGGGVVISVDQIVTGYNATADAWGVTLTGSGSVIKVAGTSRLSVTATGVTVTGITATGSVSATGGINSATVTASGNVNAATGAFTGLVSAGTCSVTGGINSATLTATGSVIGVTGSFSGLVSSASGSFSGGLNAQAITTTGNNQLGANGGNSTTIGVLAAFSGNSSVGVGSNNSFSNASPIANFGATWTNTTGNAVGVKFGPTFNQASGTGTNAAVSVEPTFTATGTNVNLLMKWGEAGVFPASIDRTGTFTGGHIVGSTSTPTAVTNTGAGTSGSITITGNDLAHKVSLVTGTTPTLSATVYTLTFNRAYAAAPRVILTPGNAAAAGLSGVTAVYVDDASTTTTTYVMKSSGTPLTGATTYLFHVLTVG